MCGDGNRGDGSWQNSTYWLDHGACRTLICSSHDSNDNRRIGLTWCFDMLRVLHVLWSNCFDLCVGSRRGTLGTSKSLHRRKRSAKVDMDQYKQGNGKIHMWGGSHDLWGQPRVPVSLLDSKRDVMIGVCEL